MESYILILLLVLCVAVAIVVVKVTKIDRTVNGTDDGFWNDINSGSHE